MPLHVVYLRRGIGGDGRPVREVHFADGIVMQFPWAMKMASIQAAVTRAHEFGGHLLVLDPEATEAIAEVDRLIVAGQCRWSACSPQWIGHPMAEALGLDVQDPSQLALITRLLSHCLENDVLMVAGEEDDLAPDEDVVRYGSGLAAGATLPVMHPPMGAGPLSGAQHGTLQ